MPRDVITFGCRLNSYESEIIRSHIEDMAEDVAVFNTCAVTKEAERQARQAIRKYRRNHPDTKILVTGCSAQIHPEQYANLDEVDQVLGNDLKLERNSYHSGFITDTERVKVNDIMAVKETANHLIQGMEERARAFMQVQNGCNHRCTFCIIPYGRGNSRSVPVGEVVKQGKMLVDAGYNEIVLTGVDMTSYGEDLPGKPRLGELVARFLKLVPELKRLRLSSIDVAEIDPTLMELLCYEPRVMPHLHLSLQAGDNMILKRMKRRHTREQVLEFCEKVRAVRPEVVFGADIIAGFPTETEAMFAHTRQFVEEAGLMHLHVFPYSEREGTPAASIPVSKQVPVAERKARAARLREAGNAQLQTFLATCVGKRERVIVEKGGIGRTEQFIPVSLQHPHDVGSIHEVTIASADASQLYEAS